jgi:hypothetical protein
VYLKLNSEASNIEPDMETVEMDETTGLKIQEFVSPAKDRSGLTDETTIHFEEHSLRQKPAPGDG